MTPNSLPPGPLASATLAFVDLEMTGLDVSRDRIVEVCVERVCRGAVVGRLDALVDPGAAMRGAGAHIHGITADTLEGASPWSAYMDVVAELLADAVIVGHAAKWDIAFLKAEFQREGRVLETPHVVDTLPLARRAFELPRHSLPALAEHLGLLGSSHRAAFDVACTRAVFDQCVARLSLSTLEDLAGDRDPAGQSSDAIRSALEAGLADGRPRAIRYRPSRSRTQSICFVVTALRSDLDPPRVIGYLHPGRGRRELCADRIVSITDPKEPTAAD